MGPIIGRSALIAAAQSLAAARPEISAIFLFGSYARGTPRPNSDVDVAIWVEPLPIPGTEFELREEFSNWLEDRLELPVDVLILSPNTQPSLLFDVFRMETILFARNQSAAHQFACRARQEYRDVRPRFERVTKAVLQRVKRREECL